MRNCSIGGLTSSFIGVGGEGVGPWAAVAFQCDCDPYYSTRLVCASPPLRVI